MVVLVGFNVLGMCLVLESGWWWSYFEGGEEVSCFVCVVSVSRGFFLVLGFEYFRVVLKVFKVF